MSLEMCKLCEKFAYVALQGVERRDGATAHQLTADELWRTRTGDRTGASQGTNTVSHI